MTRLAPASLALVLTLLAVPSAAAADPSLRASPSQGEPGDAVTLRGGGWTVGDGCANRVIVHFKQRGTRRMRLGRAVFGNRTFSFDTHYQRAEPGPARFVARQMCADGARRAVARVTVGDRAGQQQEEAVRYRGQTEHGGRVTFTVLDGSLVSGFRFMNRCATDRRRGTLVPGTMPIGDVSFARRGGRHRIRGRFRANGVVRGRARELGGGCDSGKMTWRAWRTD